MLLGPVPLQRPGLLREQRHRVPLRPAVLFTLLLFYIHLKKKPIRLDELLHTSQINMITSFSWQELFSSLLSLLGLFLLAC